MRRIFVLYFLNKFALMLTQERNSFAYCILLLNGQKCRNKIISKTHTHTKSAQFFVQ